MYCIAQGRGRWAKGRWSCTFAAAGKGEMVLLHEDEAIA